ncbi:hypothetical protein A0130_08225 [Leifsonia xyli]|uniref:SRPBCC family protein n=1 Tax=Leifsonia xyli TaxID=1575 RepID=UPI0007CDD1C0|nr:hypothetical protein A0130_08225 [Leifsonia xyli]
MVSLTVERTFPVPPERVWRGFTDPQELSAWFWPPRMEPTARIDPVPDGAVRIRSAIADLGVAGRVTEVDAPRLLAFTWRWDGEDRATRATLRFDPVGGGTLLTVQHDGFADEEAAANHVDGWNDCLDRLSATMT